MKKERYITQMKASQLVGVSKQAISLLRKNGSRSFYTKAGKIDTDHPDWKSYLKEKLANQQNTKKRKAFRDAKDNPNDFNWLNEKPTTIQEEKIYADIIQKKIAIMQDLGMLIDKKIVSSAFGEIAKQVRSNFVDLGRRVSPRISAKLKLPGSEKIIEQIINDEIKKGILNIISATKKATDKL